MTVEQAEEEVLCPNGHVTQREASGGSVQVREILDNGFQPKPVDRLSEGPRLYQEHLKDHKTEK